MPDNDRPHFNIQDALVHDDLVTKTAGGTTFKREDYGAHGRLLVRRAQAFKTAAANVQDSTSTASMFLEVTTATGVPIKQEKFRLRNVGLEVLSYSRLAENRGTARISKTAFDDLEGRLLTYATEPTHPGRSYLSVLEDFSLVPVEEKLDPKLLDAPDEPTECIVYLHSELTDRERTAILEQIQEFVLEHAGEFLDTHHFSSGVSTALVRIRPNLLRELGRDFSTVRAISPNRAFYIVDSTPIGPLPNPVNVRPPEIDIAVAVVDDGIQINCPLLRPFVRGTFAALPPGAVSPHFLHGTFVASRVAYGDDLESQIAARAVAARCWLVDVPVFGETGRGVFVGGDEHHIAAALDSALPALPANTRVINLSIGSGDAVESGRYSLVASTIDYLAKRHDVLIVTTAGNIRDRGLIAGYPATLKDPRCRVDSPGESLLSLTVGSIARFADPTTMARARQISPFSRIGPGADGGIKPELVAHGGNYVRPGTQVSRFATQGVYGDGRQVAWDNGTSFSAPLVSGMAAQLFHTYDQATANLVKALLCHFTSAAEAPDGESDLCRYIGFGEPQLESAITAAPNTGSYIYVGRLRADRYRFIPFFVPSALAAGAGGRLRIRATLVFDPVVNPVNPAEYSKCRMSVTLRKPAEVGHSDVTLGKAFRSYLPWNPVIHFDKAFSRSYATGQWEIRARLLTRELPADYEQNFALVIEVRDDSGSIDVWDEIKTEAGQLFSPVTLHVVAA